MVELQPADRGEPVEGLGGEGGDNWRKAGEIEEDEEEEEESSAARQDFSIMTTVLCSSLSCFFAQSIAVLSCTESIQAEGNTEAASG